MNTNKSRSITIFLLTGDPNGIRTAQISMSTIEAIAFRRNQLSEVRKDFPEIDEPGVYVLIGTDQADQDQNWAYIGESEEVGKRLANHNSSKDGRNSKNRWTDTVALISKDSNLTKSHARYVEARLIQDAVKNPRWTLPNIQTPSSETRKLPLPDRAAMEEFIEQTKTLVSSLGWDLFRDIQGRSPQRPEEVEIGRRRTPMFYFRGEKYSAEMIIDLSGNFVVLEGSIARINISKTLPQGISRLRDNLVEKGVLVHQNNALVFASNYSFSSVSTAAASVKGANTNGRTAWKLEDGKTTYAEWEEGESDPDDTDQADA